MAKQFNLGDSADDLGFLLWHTNLIWQRKLNRALDRIGLTHTQFAILSALKSLLKLSDSVTQKAIAQRSNTDTMMVSKVLRTLQKKGLIERREHETDTRSKCVFFTQSGSETFQDAFEIATTSNRDFFRSLKDEDLFRKELQNILRLDQLMRP